MAKVSFFIEKSNNSIMVCLKIIMKVNKLLSKRGKNAFSEHSKAD